MLNQTAQMAFDKYCFAIKNIDLASGDFTVELQYHTHFLHGGKNLLDIVEAGNTRVRIGCSSCRIILAAMDKATFFRRANFIGGGVIRKIENH